VHPGDLAGGFSVLEMTWLLYCARVATEYSTICIAPYILQACSGVIAHEAENNIVNNRV